jgi:hypothetical protein
MLRSWERVLTVGERVGEFVESDWVGTSSSRGAIALEVFGKV